MHNYLSVSQPTPQSWLIEDGTHTYAFADPDAARLFSETWQAIRVTYPDALFQLAVDALSFVTWDGAQAAPDPVATRTVWLAAQQQTATDSAGLRSRVVQAAQSAIGVRVDDLLAGQVRALLAIVLWQAGALDKDGKVKPLGDWVR